MRTFREFLNENMSSKNSTKIIPKDLKELREIMKDENVNLGDIVIPKNITSLDNLFFNQPGRTDFSGLETWDVSNVADMSGMFDRCRNFTGKEIENWNVSSATKMAHMFHNCEKFNANLSKWNISNVKNTAWMFTGCKRFTGKGLENWDTKNIEEMTGMFSGCSKFNTDLSRWRTYNLKKMLFVFQDCKSFTGKGLETWNLSNVKVMGNDFTNTKVDFRHFCENFMRKFEELGLDWKGEGQF